jgi:hypothetical protein
LRGCLSGAGAKHCDGPMHCWQIVFSENPQDLETLSQS